MAIPSSNVSGTIIYPATNTGVTSTGIYQQPWATYTVTQKDPEPAQYVVRYYDSSMGPKYQYFQSDEEAINSANELMRRLDVVFVEVFERTHCWQREWSRKDVP